MNLQPAKVGGSGTTYIGAINLALLHWTTYHDALPAATFVEEGCEAMLSRLARRLAIDQTAQGVQDYHFQFVSMGKVIQVPHDLKDPGMSVELPEKMATRLGFLFNCIKRGTNPFFPRPKGAHQARLIERLEAWPEDFTFPQSMQLLDVADTEQSMFQTLHKLMGTQRNPPQPDAVLVDECQDVEGDTVALTLMYTTYVRTARWC